MTPFEQLLVDPYAARRYLVELSPWDPAAGAEVNLYYSDQGFTTEPGDAPPNQHFEARVMEALNFQRSLFEPDSIGGASIPDFGEIVLDNADGGLDFFRTLAFDGRKVVVRLGGKDLAYAEYGVVFFGTAQDAVVDEKQATLRLRDLQYKLEVPLQAALYEAPGAEALDLAFRLLPAASQNSYLYAAVDNLPAYTLQAGDVLEYDVFWPATPPASALVAVDLFTSAGNLRSSGAADQNGLAAHPMTNLSAYASGQWYHRDIPIPATLVGAQVTQVELACEYDVPANLIESVVRGALRDIRITDGGAVVRHSIWVSADPLPTLTVNLTSDPANAVSVARLLALDGAANLVGKAKPLCFGKCLNVSPVQASPPYLTYQVHGGPIEEVDAVYAKGVKLDRDPQNPDPVNDQYTVDHDRGTFTLKQSPVGAITADVRGDRSGGVYVDTVADVVRRVLTVFGPLADADLDLATFDALNDLTSDTVGVYVPDQADTLDVLDDLINSVGAYYGFNRAGLFHVGRVEAPDRWPGVVLDGVDDHVAVGGLVYDRDDYAALTVEAWIRTSVDNRIIASWDRSEYWRLAVGNMGFPGKLTFHLYDSENAVILDLGGNADVVDGRWHHVAVVFDAGSLAFYVDGELDASYAIGSTFGKGAGIVRYGFWGVGSEATEANGAINAGTEFAGQIAEGRIWSVARTQAEIAADMDRRLNGDEPGLEGYWKFDEAAGSTASDSTPHLYHATLVGAAWNVEATFTAADVLELESEATELPLWRQKVSYQKNWTVQDADSLAGSVTDDRLAFLTEELRLATASDPAVKESHLLARDPEPIESLFDDEAAARAEAERLLELYGLRRELYRVTVKTQPYRLDLGEQVQLVYPRFGLQGGRVFRVVGLEERAEINRVTLELWG